MSKWVSATKSEAQHAVAREIDDFDITNWRYMLVDPHERAIERFGGAEAAFVVARGAERVVYFDDVEEEFGTAKDVAGRLTDAASYGPLVLALKEAAAGR